MSDALASLLVFMMLCGAAAIGRVLLARLPAAHRTRETLDYTRLVTGLLVTFVALVLGLLTASVNASFEKTGDDLQAFAAGVIRLTATLQEIGPATLPIRADLRGYVASALASTWPEEPAPLGIYPQATTTGIDFDAPNLGDVLDKVATGIMALQAPDDLRKDLKAAALTRIDAIQTTRWTLIGEAHHTITPPFVDVTVFWLIVIFLSFGLNAPPNRLATISILLVALCVASALFVLLELDGPLDGVVKVSSEPMRHALRHLDRSLEPMAGVPANG